MDQGVRLLAIVTSYDSRNRSGGHPIGKYPDVTNSSVFFEEAACGFV